MGPLGTIINIRLEGTQLVGDHVVTLSTFDEKGRTKSVDHINLILDCSDDETLARYIDSMADSLEQAAGDIRARAQRRA